ncbi:MAG: class I SAM-dependent methyltransferase, partial [Haliea sp.]
MALRDREGFHRIPGIGPERPGAEFSSASRLNFAVKPCEPNSLVIIDNDKKLEHDFGRINRTESPKVQAINRDLYDGLDRLVASMEAGDCCPRNLVTMYHLEPRALPDIPLFLDKLGGVINDSAYFLATIGAGNSESEFAARQAALNEMGEKLRAEGLRPLRIVMHGEEKQPNGQASPAFGISDFASFEILFCDLSGDSGLRRDRRRIHSPVAKPDPDLNSELWNSFLPSNRMEMAQGVITFLKRQGRLRGQAVEVLNLGSGVGVTSSCLEKVYPAFAITDVDQVPYRRELMHRNYLQADVASLPLRDHSYDVLFSSFTFSYLGNSKEVMSEWLRVLRPGGEAYFIFHAPHSAYLTTAREMLAAQMATDFFKLLPGFPGQGFAGLYDWYCRQNYAWRMAFTEEREFLSYAHEIQICKHLVEKVASQMFSSQRQIEAFFAGLDAMD